MFQTAYYNIENEQKSVRFSVNGLDGHPMYRDAPQTIMLRGLLPTLNVLE